MKIQNALENNAVALAEAPSNAGAGSQTAWSLIPRGLVSRLYPLLTEMWQVLDAAMVGGVLYVMARTHNFGFEAKHVVLIGLTTALMLLIYSWSDLFYRLRTRTLTQEAMRLLQAWATVLVLLMAIGYLTGSTHEFPRSFILTWATVAYVAQLLVHVAIRKTLHLLRQRGYNIRRALVVGCGLPLERYSNTISHNPWLGIRVEGYVAETDWLAKSSDHERGAMATTGSADGNRHVDSLAHHTTDQADAPGIVGGRLSHLGKLADVGRLVRDLSINEIYVTLPLHLSSDAEAALRALVNIPVNVNWIPDFSIAQLLSTRSDTLGGHAMILLSDSRIDRHGQLVKRVEDLVFSSILIVLLSPLILALVWAVKRSSPGPVLFKQLRHGLGGRPIVVWKFRTMRVSTGTELAKQATRQDDRITPIGRWLRRWSLDELPQLFNVWQGRMSLVGPRPHPLWLNDRFSEIVYAYMQRHRVRPGLTGWAQVHGYRGETDTLDKMEQRVKHDLYYITHWSPWLDLKTIALTIPAILFGENAH